MTSGERISDGAIAQRRGDRPVAPTGMREKEGKGEREVVD